MTTLPWWRWKFDDNAYCSDRRNGSHRHVPKRLSEEQRQLMLLTCNESEFAPLQAGQMVPALADRGLYIGS